MASRKDDRETLKMMLRFLVEGEFVPKMSSLKQEGPLVMFSSQLNPGNPRDHSTVKQIAGHRKAAIEQSFELHEDIQFNGVLFRLPVHTSDIKNCILIECSIFGGKITGSQLKDCQVYEGKSDAIGEPGSQTILECCQVEGGIIRDIIIKDSTLNGLVINSHVLQSSLTDCGVADSVLHNCELINGYLEEYITQIKSDIPIEGFEHETAAVQEEGDNRIITLPDFPPEIRKRIYSEAIKREGPSSSLITTLRPKPTLYEEGGYNQ